MRSAPRSILLSRLLLSQTSYMLLSMHIALALVDVVSLLALFSSMMGTSGLVVN